MAQTYGSGSIAISSGRFQGVTSGAINLPIADNIQDARIKFTYALTNDTQLYMALYDQSNATGNRLTGIYTQYMSLYTNDVGSYNNNVNYVRFNYYATGGAYTEGGYLDLSLSNLYMDEADRDDTANRKDTARVISGNFINGHSYISGYQMTDVGSFRHGDRNYSDTFFEKGPKSLMFYAGAGTLYAEWTLMAG